MDKRLDRLFYHILISDREYIPYSQVSHIIPLESGGQQFSFNDVVKIIQDEIHNRFVVRMIEKSLEYDQSNEHEVFMVGINGNYPLPVDMKELKDSARSYRNEIYSYMIKAKLNKLDMSVLSVSTNRPLILKAYVTMKDIVLSDPQNRFCTTSSNGANYVLLTEKQPFILDSSQCDIDSQYFLEEKWKDSMYQNLLQQEEAIEISILGAAIPRPKKLQNKSAKLIEVLRDDPNNRFLVNFNKGYGFYVRINPSSLDNIKVKHFMEIWSSKVIECFEHTKRSNFELSELGALVSRPIQLDRAFHLKDLLVNDPKNRFVVNSVPNKNIFVVKLNKRGNHDANKATQNRYTSVGKVSHDATSMDGWIEVIRGKSEKHKKSWGELDSDVSLQNIPFDNVTSLSTPTNGSSPYLIGQRGIKDYNIQLHNEIAAADICQRSVWTSNNDNQDQFAPDVTSPIISELNQSGTSDSLKGSTLPPGLLLLTQHRNENEMGVAIGSTFSMDWNSYSSSGTLGISNQTDGSNKDVLLYHDSQTKNSLDNINSTTSGLENLSIYQPKSVNQIGLTNQVPSGKDMLLMEWFNIVYHGFNNDLIRSFVDKLNDEGFLTIEDLLIAQSLGQLNFDFFKESIGFKIGHFNRLITYLGKL
eukprot:gene15104-20322_t